MFEVRIAFNSTTYSLNAVNTDHNEPIYCIRYNVTIEYERVVLDVLIYLFQYHRLAIK